MLLAAAAAIPLKPVLADEAMGILRELAVADPVATLPDPLASQQLQQGFSGCAEVDEEEVFGVDWLAVAGSCGGDINAAAGADPCLTDMLWRHFCWQHRRDVSAMVDLVIHCQKRLLACAHELRLELVKQHPRIVYSFAADFA